MAEVAAQNAIVPLLKETLFAGITAVSGAALAFYTYRNSANRIWPVTHSVASVLGTCNSIRYIYKITRISALNYLNQNDDECSPMNVATGTIVYFSSLYAFSEFWKCNNKLWIPCLGTAACGLYFGFSSIYRMRSVSNLKPLLKWCELAFKPALIGLGAGYLRYFQDHDEELLQWPPLVLIFFNALGDLAAGTIIEPREDEPKLLLLKGIELLMGSCFLAVSSTVLTVYFSVKKYHWIVRACMAYVSFSSLFNIFAAIICFQKYFGMEEVVLYNIIGLITGVAMVLSSGLMVKYMGNIIMKYFPPIFSLCGYILLCASIDHFIKAVPRPVIGRYCQRTLGSLFAISSTAVSAYVGSHMGWRYSLMVLPLPCAGIYAAYKGFSSTITRVPGKRGTTSQATVEQHTGDYLESDSLFWEKSLSQAGIFEAT